MVFRARSAVLEFFSEVDGITINGVDIIQLERGGGDHVTSR